VATVSAGWEPNPRRILWPFLCTLVIVAGTWTPPGELRDAATRDPVTGMRLVYSDPYIWGAPWFDLLDVLGVLTWSQRWAVAATLLVVHVAWRGWRWRQRQGRLRPWREGLLLAATIGAMGLVAATGALVPRPMAKLVVFDDDALVADFRARSGRTVGARAGFTASWRRRWSTRAGFHVAWVDDAAGAREAMADNPSRAGAGLVVLPAHRATRAGQPVLQIEGAVGQPPVIVQTLPAHLDAVERDTAVVHALEIADGSARGLEQALDDHDRLVRLARDRRLALVAGSNHLGWGSTAPAWTVLRVPGWRAMSPEALQAAVVRVLTARDAATDGTVRVVERRTPELGRGPALAFTVPLMLYELNATLSPSQRLSWICWIWGLFHLGPLTGAWFRGRRRLRAT
jgi:hypothetical protein